MTTPTDKAQGEAENCPYEVPGETEFARASRYWREISRLRAELAQIGQAERNRAAERDTLYHEGERLRAENEKLKAKAEKATEWAQSNATDLWRVMNERDQLKAEVERLTTLVEGYRSNLKDWDDQLTAAQAEVESWRTKALDCAEHPVVVRLKEELTALRAIADAAREVCQHPEFDGVYESFGVTLDNLSEALSALDSKAGDDTLNG